MEQIFYNYDDFRGDVLEIARKIQLSGFQPKYIAGIARGGLVPAVFLSHWFQAPFLNIHLSLRDHQRSLDTSDLKFDGNILIVDDIVDNGETLSVLKSHLSKFDLEPGIEIRYSTLYFNTAQTKVQVDYYAREIDRTKDQRWINFFFESFHRS